MRPAAIIAAAALLAIAAAAWMRAGQVAEVEQSSGEGWSWDNLTDEIEQMSNDDTSQAGVNLAAFLYMIRACEGTASENGYRMMFGGRLFSSYDDHPRIAHQFKDQAGRVLYTSAAGAYQFMAVSPIPGGGSTRVNTWDRLQSKLGLPDFSPASQDQAAIALVDECGAIADARAGRVLDAARKCRKVWASLPGAGYDQPEKSTSYIVAQFERAGGVTA